MEDTKKLLEYILYWSNAEHCESSSEMQDALDKIYDAVKNFDFKLKENP